MSSMRHFRHSTALVSARREKMQNTPRPVRKYNSGRLASIHFNKEISMTLSMYAASIPALKQTLGSLSAILTKTAAHAESRQIDPGVLLNARLFPDMFPLVRQIQIATDQAKGCAARLARVEIPKFDDTETSFEQLQARIAKTIAFLDSFSAQQIDGSEESDIVLQLHEIKLEFKGQDYLLKWVLPNFYFHATTAYNILRHNGVDIGKRDFLGK
jgi:hypothetical protein